MFNTDIRTVGLFIEPKGGGVWQQHGCYRGLAAVFGLWNCVIRDLNFSTKCRLSNLSIGLYCTICTIKELKNRIRIRILLRNAFLIWTKQHFYAIFLTRFQHLVTQKIKYKKISPKLYFRQYYNKPRTIDLQGSVCGTKDSDQVLYRIRIQVTKKDRIKY